MNRFQTADLLWLDACDRLLTAPPVASRNGGTKEIVGYAATLVDPTANFVGNLHRKMSPSYAAGEMLWYLRGSDDGAIIEHYAPQYKRFLQPKGYAWGAYGARMAGEFQIPQVIRILRTDRESRQAVISLWDPELDLRERDDDGNDILDRPCTLTLQFLVRNGRLCLIATMRSNDVWLGMPYDIFCFTTLQQIIAQELGLGLGDYHHRVGSFHVYDKNIADIALATTESYYGFRFPHDPVTQTVHDMIAWALPLEEGFRLKEPRSGLELRLNQFHPTVWGRLVLMASSKNNVWTRSCLKTMRYPERIITRILQEAEKRKELQE